MRCARLGCSLLIMLALAGCGGSGQRSSTTAEFPEFGFKLEMPSDWMNIAGDLQNKRATQLTFKLENLVGAEHTFLARLPQSIEPQLANWTKFHFTEVVEKSRGEATVGGIAAWTITYESKVRPGADITLVRYWVVVKGDLLYLFRVVFPPGSEPEDGPVAAAMIGSIRFIEAAKTNVPPLAPNGSPPAKDTPK